MIITIAIPTYNNGETIEKAISSALNQDYREDYEILVVNNASTDRTHEIIETFTDCKIRHVVNKKTVDMYSNHNICLKEAKGDYVLFCHGDDELLPNALTIITDRIKERKYPKRYILWGHSLYSDFYPSIFHGNQMSNTMFSGEAAVRCFLDGGLTPSGTCYSRQALVEMGGFPSSNSKAPAMDWVIMVLTAFNCFEYEMVDRLYFKRTDASTAVRSLTNKEQIDIHKDAVEKMFEIMTDQQKSFFLAQLMSRPSLLMLKAVREHISTKMYIMGYIKSKIANIIG